MAGQSRKWMILVATIWIQAFTGTNFDFSAYSSELKKVLGISQVQLNYLAVASDLGKAFGWSSGLASLCLPLWVVMFIAAFMGLFGYGVQWLVIRNIIVLPYFVGFGEEEREEKGLGVRRRFVQQKLEYEITMGFELSINILSVFVNGTVHWVAFDPAKEHGFGILIVAFDMGQEHMLVQHRLLCSMQPKLPRQPPPRNLPHPPALYTLAAKAIDPSSNALYLLLNAAIPLITSLVSLVPILRQPPLTPLPPDAIRRDSLIFLLLNVFAVITGLYLLFIMPTDSSTSRLLFGGAISLLILPLGIPGIVYARDWFHCAIHSSFRLDGSGFILVDADELELHKELINRETIGDEDGPPYAVTGQNTGVSEGCCAKMMERDRLVMLGEEHKARMLVSRLDFWLYYVAYFCGGTIGLVYSNNLGQIAQSLGQGSETSTLITLYSSFSFFGRLLSAAPDFMRVKVYFARTGWLAIGLVPTPIAFFLLAASGNTIALQTGTALIGLSSGFIFAAAVSITSELFGPNNVGVNHNILITNIPVGSLVYGLLAALVYDSNARPSIGSMVSDSVVCMGRKCYFLTFVWWGCISVIGLASSVLLFLRTRPAYDRFEKNRRSTLLY
ncbi:hypothetical protein HYC85_022676 [Camellia sinensis]|uniref:Nodulin-like domain-containing protein n=1 Tax=Camellia sinensis TaxID=4442 RepID=A0A7J7GCY4_CAMSI|nr:hypothetical protein HYC85_022676 [Camellia sinensis]